MFGVDIAVLDFILNSNPSDLIGVKTLTIGGHAINLFRPTDHDRIDHILGFTNADHTEFLDIADIQNDIDPESDLQIEFHPGAKGHLKPNVEYNKEKFAAYANSVVLAKLALLQENLVDEAPVGGLQPKTISHVFSDLTGQPYDFALMDLNGNHGGNILTATLPDATDIYGQPTSVFDIYPGPISSDLWITSIDDQSWREDSQTSFSELYRTHDVGIGANKVEWRFDRD